VFDILKEHTAVHAAYNSRERESEHASTCQEGTRRDVLRKISTWSREIDGPPICWLQGPAGSGKSTIAHTIAKQCDDDRMLAFSFFFSRGRLDRSDTTKFFPTFAYQLAESFPAIQTSMRCALAGNPSIPHLRLSDQIVKLIVEPILTIERPIPSMIVVIDALDECGEENFLQELIRLLVDTTNQLPFRILFTSRPETYIQQTFESPSIKSKSYFLALRDFDARDDIHEFLQLHLSKIREKEHQLMRGVPRPWPSRQELEVLVKQSEGLFIYVSTLLKFVADGRGLPQEKLQVVMTAHTGVDPLYDQVLSAARKFEYFERVVGTIINLRWPLAVGELAQLLQLQSSYIRLGLRGCQSVVAVPDTDSESVQPYHASLRDFLSDHDRAKGHFLDPMMYHVYLLVDCLQLIKVKENCAEGGKHFIYASQNWCYHFSFALQHQATMGFMNAHCNNGVVMLMRNMEWQWLKLWMYELGSFNAVRTVCQDCELALVRMAVSLIHHSIWKYLSMQIQESPAQWKAVEGSIRQIQKVLKVSEY